MRDKGETSIMSHFTYMTQVVVRIDSRKTIVVGQVTVRFGDVDF